MTVTLTWLGHSAFELKSKTAHVLIDPFITGNPTATVDPSTLSPTTILVTHAHNDHVGDTVAIAKRTGCKVITVVELADWLEGQGVEGTWGGNHGGTVDFQGGTAKFVPAWHSSSYATKEGEVASGVPAGFVVRVDGVTIYFAGDTALFLDMQLIGDEGIDVAVLPIGDNFTMGPKDAARAVEFLRASQVIPCHYNTFSLIQQDPEAFKALVESSSTAMVTVPALNEVIELAAMVGKE